MFLLFIRCVEIANDSQLNDVFVFIVNLDRQIFPNRLRGNLLRMNLRSKLVSLKKFSDFFTLFSVTL